MKIRDIFNHLSKLLYAKTGKKVFVEQIGELTQDCIYLELVDSRRVTHRENVERLTITVDVKYYDSVSNSSNMKIQDMLDEINLAFDRDGYKCLSVLDRVITIQEGSQTIVDGVGHYIFEMSLLVEYGNIKQYKNMLELELII